MEFKDTNHFYNTITKLFGEGIQPETINKEKAYCQVTFKKDGYKWTVIMEQDK